MNPFYRKSRAKIKKNLSPSFFWMSLLLFAVLPNPLSSQISDPLTNGDGIHVEWTNASIGDKQVENPEQQWILDDIIGGSERSVGLTSNLPIIIINTNGVEIPDEPKITGNMSIINNGPGNLNNQNDPPNDYNGFIGINQRTKLPDVSKEILWCRNQGSIR